MQLNLVFHDVVKQNPYDEFTITYESFFEILDFVEGLVQENSVITDYRLYFDDGFLSIDELLKYLTAEQKKKVIVSVVKEYVDKTYYLPMNKLRELVEGGINIVPHSVSHAALAIYDASDTKLLSTPIHGQYQNTPFGKSKALSENEVLYQLLVAKNFIKKVSGKEPNEFVLPFGLYNTQTITINKRFGIYDFLDTCDSFLDDGQPLRPRYLIWGNKSLATIKQEIISLIHNV